MWNLLNQSMLQRALIKPINQLRFMSALPLRQLPQEQIKYIQQDRIKKKKGIRDIGGELPKVLDVPVSVPAPKPFKATGFCTAENYNLLKLIPILKQKYTLDPSIADGIVHIRLTAPETKSVENSQLPEAFIFEDGTFVSWAASMQENNALLKALKPAEVNPYDFVESERFDYYVDSSQIGGLSSDIIILGNELPPSQAKLAFSSGMARSVKLSCLEVLLDKHLDKNRRIPTILLLGKKLPVGEDAVLRNLGELFSLRGSVNLHSELLDSPEFAWSNEKMEYYFEKISKNLDVKPRIAIFNKKLDYANELAEVLRNHLHEKHSIKLEWFIIILICVEIAFEFLHYAEKLGFIHFPNN